jgi:hypothetical protein
MIKIVALQNVSDWAEEIPTIKITIFDAGWSEAFENWKKGKNPTDSLEWKKGVFAITSFEGE